MTTQQQHAEREVSPDPNVDQEGDPMFAIASQHIIFHGQHANLA